MKKLMVVLLSSLLVLSLSVGFVNAAATKTPAKKIKMAFMAGVADPFYFTMERGIRAAAKKYNVDLLVGKYPTKWGADQQVPILEAMLSRGDFAVIITAPTSTDALIPVLKKFYNKGIQVITVDTYIGDGNYTKKSNYNFPLSYIGTDNYAGGKLVAETLAGMLNKTGKVYINTTTPDTSSVIGRRDGFLAGIKQFPKMSVVGVDYNGDNQEKAQEQTLARLQANDDIVGAFGTNLFSAQGVHQAVVNANKTGQVKIASWDATKDLIQALKDGKVDLVLAQKPYNMGFAAVEQAVKFLKAPKTYKIPKKMNPGFAMFTKANVNKPEMQQYIYK